MRRAATLCGGRGKLSGEGELAGSAPKRRHVTKLLAHAWLKPAHACRLTRRFERLSVPHAWFWHFYAVGFAVNGAVLWRVARHAAQPAADAGGAEESSFVLFLFQLHLLRRLVESKLLTRTPRGARMHVVLYLGGAIIFQLASSLLHVCRPRILCRGKARALLAHLGNSLIYSPPRSPQLISPSHVDALLQPPRPLPPPVDARAVAIRMVSSLGMRHIVGAAVFLIGTVHQACCHAILAALRPRGSIAQSEYRIPHGDWFERVSCPHFLA